MCVQEDVEAGFYSDIDECADKCRFYLDEPELRKATARRGRERAVRSGYDNDTLSMDVRKIILPKASRPGRNRTPC